MRSPRRARIVVGEPSGGPVMTPRARSWTGLVVTVVAVPALIGILACMSLPVPIGDPEESHVDPALSGVWLQSDAEIIWLFQPYDRRTWLVTGVEIGKASPEAEVAPEIDRSPRPTRPDGDPAPPAIVADRDAAPEPFVAGLEAGEIEAARDRLTARFLASGEGATALRGDGVMNFKAWLAPVGDREFLTWQPMRLEMLEEAGQERVWFVFRVDRPDEDTLVLHGIDSEHFEALDLPLERRAYERYLRKHVDEARLYLDEPLVFIRADEALLPAIREIVNELFPE